MSAAPSEATLITVHRTGRYAEVGFRDFEDETKVAWSGLLDPQERAALASRLREVAAELEALP